MKRLFLASMLLLPVKSFAYVPSSLSELAGKEGIFQSDFGKGRCSVELAGDDLIIRTDIEGHEKIIVPDLDELRAINNSQFLTNKKRTQFCHHAHDLVGFREIISSESDSIYIAHAFQCSGRQKSVAASCINLR